MFETHNHQLFKIKTQGETMLRSILLKYYKREDIRKAMVACAKGKEIAVKYGDRGFGKRPDVLANAEDVLEFAKRGATSFHCSEELWANPLALDVSMKQKQIEQLRTGWDLVLDIDGWFPLSKIAAQLLIDALQFHDIKTISVKFSGNKGFHIGVPNAAFPKIIHGKEVATLFPDGPRKIAAHLKGMIEDHLRTRMQEKYTIQELFDNTNVSREDALKNGKLDPFAFVDIDTLLISSRHLYRMPYSFHEKSGLVSVPINIEDVETFEREHAKPEKVTPDLSFLTTHPSAPEAASLIRESFDTQVVDIREEHETKTRREYQEITEALPESCFPPCVHNIFKGLKDGKKRAVFAMINFLRSVGWEYEQIEERLMEWNKQNQDPLRDVTIKGQIRYHKQHKKKVLPPNCDNDQYYIGIGVCKPDSLCRKIKNPVSYARRRAQLLQREKPKEKPSPKEKPKEQPESA